MQMATSSVGVSAETEPDATTLNESALPTGAATIGSHRGLFMADGQKMARTEAIISYIFHDEAILWEALQTHGKRNLNPDKGEVQEANSRLALVGDRIAAQDHAEDWHKSGHPRCINLERLLYLIVTD